MKQFSDLHIHPFIRPAAENYVNPQSPKSSPWYQDIPKKKERDDFIIKYTQSDFTSLVQGGIKLAFSAFYPFEQQWFTSVGTGIVIDILAKIFTGLSKKYIDYVQSNTYNYRKELENQRKYFKKFFNNPHTVFIDGKEQKFTAKIPQNKDELKQFLNEENTLIVIPTIEGIASLFNGNAQSTEEINIDELKNYIKHLKNTSNTPFFITFAHHFYNGLCGHAISIFSENKLLDFVETSLIHQKKGIDSHFTPNAKDIAKCLLSIDEYKNTGKRILIDIKHMNVVSREQFYALVLEHNANNPDDKIPIIASHVAYSGKSTFAQLTKSLPEAYNSSSGDFDEADINLCDDDIVKIFASEGIIGINLDQRILANKKVIEKSKQYENNLENLRLFWAKQIVKNIIGMAKPILNSSFLQNKERVWDTFAIGSDYDGFIDPINGFITDMELNELNHYLAQALSTDQFFLNNNFGLTAAELANKIMFENSKNFLIKHYWEETGNETASDNIDNIIS